MWGTVGSVRSNHPMPADINVFYYEITVLSSYAEAPYVHMLLAPANILTNTELGKSASAYATNGPSSKTPCRAGLMSAHSRGDSTQMMPASTRQIPAWNTMWDGIMERTGDREILSDVGSIGEKGIYFSQRMAYFWVFFSNSIRMKGVLTICTGVAFENPRGRLFPVCGTRVASHEAKWQANFGQDPEKKFVFDIEAYKNGEKMERLGPVPAK